ncbi:hypothetical protein VKI21_18835 [Cyanobacterium aponinum UTEX 3222]|uniref:Uncharacterized protein n=3 Tax=Cyanobacterium aponinum TaxID=379064 RepID=K9Z5K5_CYAAP|nr:hypothetical protein [Cyanobacterium aponinum]WRL42064.1 hypothetical protein VKI21_18835 [Cyanobacterium aponinum UTEX 3222]AFZ54022.1 hypothetical protein Cyan10605_1926 [Cyanobacterium aponinum PCC 10605]MTF38607.1 hypothetical protein [Cyanobacterium aponinum 0216]PHV62740.1 hypothetical protein CSQ80_09205 [Cyanobacterium aponinum IPPAS B-1201]WPF89299.1 hypothetical protein SAY89_03200 [Cyanobacterium aponinum AL20115]
MLSNITNYTINNSLETGKNMLKELGDRAINSSNNLTDAMSKNVQSSLESLWNNWIGNHPLIGFFVSHPLIFIIVMITLVLTIWGVIQMIPSLLVRLWLSVFKSPFILGKSLLKNNQQDTLKEEFYQLILNKLDAIESKQNQLEQQLSQSKNQQPD